MLAALWIAPVAHYWFGALDAATKDGGTVGDRFARRMFKALKMVSLDETVGAFIINAGWVLIL